MNVKKDPDCKGFRFIFLAFISWLDLQRLLLKDTRIKLLLESVIPHFCRGNITAVAVFTTENVEDSLRYLPRFSMKTAVQLVKQFSLSERRELDEGCKLFFTDYLHACMTTKVRIS